MRRPPFCRSPPISHSKSAQIVYDVQRLQTWFIFRLFKPHPFVSWGSFPRLERRDTVTPSYRSCSWGESGLSVPFQMGSLSTPAIYRASLAGDQATVKRRLGVVEWSGMEESRLIAGTALSVVETWRKEWRCCVLGQGRKRNKGLAVGGDSDEINRHAKKWAESSGGLGVQRWLFVFWTFLRDCETPARPMVNYGFVFARKASTAHEGVGLQSGCSHGMPQGRPDLDLRRCATRQRRLDRKHAIILRAGGGKCRGWEERWTREALSQGATLLIEEWVGSRDSGFFFCAQCGF